VAMMPTLSAPVTVMIQIWGCFFRGMCVPSRQGAVKLLLELTGLAMVGHILRKGGDGDVALFEQAYIGGRAVVDVAIADQLKDGLAELGLMADEALVEACAGVGGNFDAFRGAFGQLRDVDVDDAAWLDREESPDDGGAVLGGLLKVAGDMRGFNAQAQRDGWDIEEGAFHGGGDGAGVIDIDACVGAVVYARDEQVDGAVVEFHNGELDTVGGRAFDAIACELAVDVNLVADQRPRKGDAVASAGAAGVRCNDSDLAEADELFVNGCQARCEDAVIICQ